MQTKIRSSLPNQHQQLLSVWQQCIESFQKKHDLQHVLKIKELITEHHYFRHLQLFHLEINHEIVGFIGLAYQKIEMFYVHPKYIGLGVGSALLKYALSLGIQEVDILENHPDLQHFYQKHGFEVIARSAWDTQGQLCPTLHLRLHPHC
ncbi:GNAT family N-acetyltransferase [Acinetobacter sp. CFCC 10889]|uniref:GNAT family N-acetyltransferase n=1 Tax=Acinetobacter sp. CFCC 10889 TaxID=1775557 RepID=UPI000DCF6A95|nr:GNAT family N-acetyltransferase [Acinetobacter sp. CFCC 10889]